jgi:predicted CXXCH cytochrome family protein
MKTLKGSLSGTLNFIQKHKALACMVGAVSAITFSSCVYVHPVVILPPKVAGAEFVGSEACSECHEALHERFEWATHARLMELDAEGKQLGCEACHGAGSIHVESGGMPRTIVNPKGSPEACFQCHQDVRASFSLPHGHPMGENQVTCQDCHNPHEGPAIENGGMALSGAADGCVKCHQAQNGHYVFRHEATQDGCVVCHSPHGSVNAKLLKSSNPTLCLQCHFQHQTSPGVIMIGGRDHSSFLSRGTCWTAGCHEAVHGSNISSSLRY